MSYTFQTFSVAEVLTASKMNQVEVNVRDHAHGSAGVSNIGNSIVDAVGDLIVGTAADTAARVGVGSDLALLVADSAQVAGVKWGTAGQIVFPATQAASGGANTLDDYEEGTWTPAIRFSGGTTGITYGTRVGKYTKIGNFVSYAGQLTLTSKGSSTGSVFITGLPFTTSSPFCSGSIIWFLATSSFYSMAIQQAGSTAEAQIMGNTAAAVTVGTPVDSDLANNTTFEFSFNSFTS